MPLKRAWTADDLINLAPKHSTLVCVDSDGCIFDTMEIKQKKCFHGLIVTHWGLQPIEGYVRETAEFVNLYSSARGQNRFPALMTVFDLLRERREIVESGIEIPRLPALRRLIDSGAPLGNPSLAEEVRRTGNPELASLLKWSNDVNRAVAENVGSVPPFAWARKSLDRVSAGSDIICTSQTPAEALVREWDEHGLTKYVSVIAGQELGTKSRHIALAADGRFKPDDILMVGDAFGDLHAARENNALFYPINPGREEASWERFCTEAYDRFLDHRYAGEYERHLIAEFEKLLPSTPPWL